MLNLAECPFFLYHSGYDCGLNRKQWIEGGNFIAVTFLKLCNTFSNQVMTCCGTTLSLPSKLFQNTASTLNVLAKPRHCRPGHCTTRAFNIQVVSLPWVYFPGHSTPHHYFPGHSTNLLPPSRSHHNHITTLYFSHYPVTTLQVRAPPNHSTIVWVLSRLYVRATP